MNSAQQIPVVEARRAVASTRYPPNGIRGVSAATRATRFDRIKDYVFRVEEETTVILQLETAKAVSRAEEIAAVDGVTGIFFGPADIAADISKTGQLMCTEVWDLILPVARKLRNMGIPTGTLVMDAEFATTLLNTDFTFVACGSDTTLLARASDDLLAKVRNGLEKTGTR